MERVTPPWLEPLQPLDDGGVLAANALFYEALDRGDLDRMEQVWSHTDDVACAHPGRVPLQGWPEVWASWRAILALGGNPQIIITEMRLIRRDRLAWVTLSENMISGRHAGVATALNLFEHDGFRWRMVIHHASPVFAGA